MTQRILKPTFSSQFQARRLISIIAIILTCSFSSSFAAATRNKHPTVGTPWTGAPGITETVDQIMSRSGQEQDSKKEEREKEHPHQDRESALPSNPGSPSVSQTPGDSSGTNSGPSPLVAQTVGTSFIGVQSSESAFIPPDSMGAVGPSQIMVIANGRIKTTTRAGATSGLNADTDTFFASVRAGSGTSDPHIRYDRLTGRWFVVMITTAIHNNRILVAVSSGPVITNTTSFTFYQFEQDFDGGDAGLFADYPTLGVDKFALYIGVNNFISSAGGRATRAGFVVRKSNLLTNGPIVVTSFRNLDNDGFGNGIWTPQGVDNDDPNATEGYFIGIDSFTTGKLNLRRISDPGGTPTISPSLTLTVPATTHPIPQAHKVDTLNKKLDSIDDRLFAAAIHKNSFTGSNTLWTAHTIEVDTNGVAVVGGNRNGSRWYEIGDLTTTPVLIQAGTLFDSTVFSAKGYWMPSVAMSGQGHMALGCSYAASNAYAGVAFAGRLRTDPPGSTQPSTLAVVAANSYNVSETSTYHRWGDYSQTVVDPNDDMTMWTFQEYCNKNDGWAVRVLQLRAPPPATPVACSPSTLTTGQSNVDLLITGDSSSGAEFFDPGLDPGGPGFSNHISAVINGGGITVNSVTFSNITNVTLNVTVSPCATPGDRTITVVNPDGRTTMSPTTLLTVLAAPCISAQPQSQSIAAGSDATFTLTASGTDPIAYQWRFNQIEISGATNNTYTRPAVQCGDAGAYDVVVTNSLGSTTSSVATLTVVTAPMITAQPPASQTITNGQTATFSVSASNDCGDSLSYQWTFQSTNVAGATSSSYSRTNAQFSDSGDYTVIVSSLAGSITSSVASLTVLSSPTISQPPQSLIVSQGSNASFTVTAVGTPPLNYQWRLNQLEIPGANLPSYVRTNAQCTDAGGYDVVVTNIYGSCTSSVASLAVIALPGVDLQPTNLTLNAGQDAAFFATATNACGAGFAYQWQLNGTNIAGATTNNLTITNAQPANAGDYTLVVTNIAGSVTSSVATLTIIAPAVAAFAGAPTNGFAPLLVSFTNLSTSATNYLWVFGDGNTSTATNPLNTYSNSGAFSVTLTATGPGGTNTFTATNYIVVNLRPSVVPSPLSGTNFVFSFQTLAGKNYTIEYKDSLDDLAWQTLQTVPGNGSVQSVTNSTTSPSRRFFRLNIQ